MITQNAASLPTLPAHSLTIDIQAAGAVPPTRHVCVQKQLILPRPTAPTTQSTHHRQRHTAQCTSDQTFQQHCKAQPYRGCHRADMRRGRLQSPLHHSRAAASDSPRPRDTTQQVEATFSLPHRHKSSGLSCHARPLPRPHPPLTRLLVAPHYSSKYTCLCPARPRPPIRPPSAQHRHRPRAQRQRLQG